MSWYTTIFPEGEFDHTLTKEKLQESIDEDKHILDYLWERITGVCVSSPSLYHVNDPIEHVSNIIKQHFDKYIEVSDRQNYNCLNLDFVNSKGWTETPYISYNHFPHENDPEGGVSECEDSINTIRRMITAYAVAVPKDILIVNNADEMDEGCECRDAVKYLIDQLDDYREWLDRELYDLAFAKLCTKYWDTHELG